MAQTADDPTVVEAAQRILARHNQDPGEPGGYLLDDPFVATRFQARRRATQLPRPGYVAVPAGETLQDEGMSRALLISKILQARRERASGAHQ